MSPRTPTTRPDPLAEAIRVEEAIAAEAAEVRREASELTPVLFGMLRPLLRRPIPAGFIVSTGNLPGKPYSSTGIKSVQTLIDRMDAVLTPLWWSDEAFHYEDGKLCRVIVTVGNPGQPFFSRESYGGVDRASTIGNLWKSSYTNAAKLAIARVGPGHEVYLGATDLDPDVSEDAAKAQATAEAPPAVKTITAEDAAKLRDLFDQSGLEPNDLKLKLGSMGVSAKSVNQGFASMTPAQAGDIEGWLAEKAQVAA